MTVIITTYDGRVLEVSEKTAEGVNRAMAEGNQYVKLTELGVTLAVNDIRRMDGKFGGSDQGLEKPKYQMPRDHDTVVVDEHYQFRRSYKLGRVNAQLDYSDEALAIRRADNKIKYAPKGFVKG